MSTRRGTRLRRKPTPIYQVEDTRTSADDADTGAQDAEDVADVEESSDEGQEDDEEFHPLKTKRKTPKKAPTPVKPRSARRKRSPWSKARSAERKSRKVAIEPVTAAGSEDEDEENKETLFEAIQSGKKPLEQLLAAWRERFEADEEKSTREVLNFVLQSCGGVEQYVPDAVPLIQLDLNDLVELVVKDVEKDNGEYPLASRAKGMKKFQRSFEEFWEVFVKECYESEVLFSSDIASSFVDWLTTMSSSEVRAIRHTSSVAVLALSNALVTTATAISDQLAIATRQLNAELNSPSTSGASRKSPNAPKVALLKENKARYQGRLEQILKLINLVFTGVVVHRYRDVMSEIRVASMRCLGSWITTMPDQFLKDNFLKYLGWLLNDKTAAVRLEVVLILCELYENDAFTERLELFTSRFLPRYLDLCNDVDDAVVEECIHLLIAVDKCNLVSSDIELQPVEKLVFDAEHEDIRKAAAEFVCLQYDAFGVAVAQTSSAKLKKEQLNTQAIALVEFAEEYIQNHDIPEGAVETLADAFWGLEDCLVLQDWRVMTDLLLVDKSAPDLTSEQQTILLRLLVASVGKLVGVDAGHGPAKKQADALREEITVAYCKDIPSLFHLYQADSDKLELLLQLIPMLTLKADVIGHHSNDIKELLGKLKHAYTAHSDAELLTSLSLSITHLLHTEHVSLRREAEAIVRELLQEVMDKTDSLLIADAKLFEALAASGEWTPTTRSKQGKGRKKKKHPKANEISDVEYSLRVALCRLKCLIRLLNVREYLPSNLISSAVSDSVSAANQQLTRMDTLPSALVDLLRRRTKAVLQLDEGFRHADTIKHVLMIIYSDLLWVTAPVFKSVEENKRSSDESKDAELTDSNPSIQLQIQKVCHSRATLEEALVSVLEMHLTRSQETPDESEEATEPDDPVSLMEEISFDDVDVAAYVKVAQRYAFLTYCDARCLFVEKFQDALPPYNALEWTLPKVLILLTQTHFEKEMEEADEDEPELEDDTTEENLAERADALREWEEKQQQKAELLVALGRVSLCNPNKKYQAATVLQYFTSSGKPSVEVVKAFGKQVKTDAPVRYLEIQMTALRQMFNPLLAWKQDLAAAMANENPSDEESSELEELKERVANSEQELKELAKRFGQSLGVGKIASSLRAPFLRFLCEGVRYAMEKTAQFEFLEFMRVYLSHLDKSSTAQLREYFMERLAALRDVPEDGEDLDPRWRAVFDFQSAISATSGRRQSSMGMIGSPPLKNKRRSATSELTPMQQSSIAEEDEDRTRESEPFDSINGAKGADNDENLSTRKRTATDEDELSPQEAVAHRKRPRQENSKDDVEMSDADDIPPVSPPRARSSSLNEAKSEEDTPPHQNGSKEQDQKGEDEQQESRSRRKRLRV